MYDILNYKRFYKGSKIKYNVVKLTEEELDKGFVKLVGYSNEMDNFLNAVELNLLQEGFLNQLKKYCNKIFGVFKVFDGMDIHIKKIIEDKMVVYSDMNNIKYEIVNE